MADKDDKGAEGEEPKKKKPILLIVGVLVLVLGAAAAGIFVGPMLMGPPPAPEPVVAAAAAATAPSATADIVTATVQMAPFIIDSHDADGITHHIKVTVSIELKDTVAEADFRPYIPRGREVAIAYLRSQEFEELTDPGRFDEVRAELSKRIIEAVGENRAGRVLITDFVAQ